MGRTVIKRQAARLLTQELELVFNKNDLDADGVLNNEEIMGYTKNEFGFDCPQETLGMINRHLVKDGAEGVSFENFHLLNTTVGIAREIARDKVRKAEKIERERLIAQVKIGLQDRLREVSVVVDGADISVNEMDKQVAPLLMLARKMPVDEMCTLADQTDTMIEEASEAISTVWKWLD